jgi:hypothetical protein
LFFAFAAHAGLHDAGDETARAGATVHFQIGDQDIQSAAGQLVQVGCGVSGSTVSEVRRLPSPRPRWTLSAIALSAAARRLHGMTRLDPLTAGADAKRTALLLRDARAVLRRLDILASVAIAADDPAVLLTPRRARPWSGW